MAGVFWQELVSALRLVRRHPGSSAAAILMLGVGLGAVASCFILIRGTHLRGLPFDRADRLMRVAAFDLSEGQGELPIDGLDYLDYSQQQTSFEKFAAWAGASINLGGEGTLTQRYNGAYVTANALDATGARPLLGSSFADPKNQVEAVIVSHRLWTQHFAQDPSIIGKSLTVGGKARRIVGVMGEGFRFPLNQDVWLPLRLEESSYQRGRGWRVQVFGRLHDGIGRKAAETDLRTIAAKLAAEYPATNEDLTVEVSPYAWSYTDPQVRRSERVMVYAVLGLLLIVCVNVASLLLGRLSGRQQGIGIRMATGAGKGTILFALLVEALALALAGAVLAICLAWMSPRLYASLSFPFWVDFKLDAWVVALTFLLSLLAGGFCAFVTATYAVAIQPQDLLRESSYGLRDRCFIFGGKVLIICELALTLALIVLTLQVARSVRSINSLHFGREPDHVFIGWIQLPDREYPDQAARQQFVDELLLEVERIPGVETASVATTVPGHSSKVTELKIDGLNGGEGSPKAELVAVSPGYFNALGVDIVRGSSLDGLTHNSKVAVVSQRFARELLPDGDVLELRVQWTDSADPPWLTIVGVASDAVIGSPVDSSPGIYVPFAQRSPGFFALLVRGSDPHSLTRPVRQVVSKLNAGVPIFWIETLQTRIRLAMSEAILVQRALQILAMVAVLLAGLGFFGVLSLGVSMKRREIAIRTAMGADSWRIIVLVLGDALRPTAVGLLIGVALAWASSRGVRSILFGVDRLEWPTAALAANIILVISVVVALASAWQALRFQPNEVLRGG